ncbi:hypothetical protein CLOSS21_01606 [Clostridium sp. SS2/1]|nr:hypothetical protein CLOSS21_01606 [Clostridium sp. SS2/1]
MTQLLQAFSKGREASLLVYSTFIGISDTDTGKDPCFVDIKATTVIF